MENTTVLKGGKMKLSKVTILFTSVILACVIVMPLLTTGYAGAASPSEKFHLRVQSALPLPHMMAANVQWFCKELPLRTKGRITTDFYPALGMGMKITEIAPALSEGLVDVSDMAGAAVAWYLPLVELMELPGLVPSDVKLRKQIALKLLPYYESAFAEKGIVLFHIAQMEGRSIFTKKPVATLADLKGLKIRSHGPTENAVLSAFGASPTNIPWGEVYTAMAQGICDGYGTTLSGTWSNKMYEVARYCYEIGWDGAVVFFCANKKAFEALPPDIQKIVKEVGYEAYERMWKVVPGEDALYREKLMKEKGMQFTTASPSEVNPLLKQAFDSYSKVWLNKAGPKALEMIEVVKKMVK